MAGKDFDYTFTGKFSEDLRSLIIDSGGLLLRAFYPLKENALEIRIRPYYKRRTDAQNRYIWGVVIPCIRAWMKETTGQTPPTAEAIYVFLRVHVCEQEPVIEMILGQEVVVIKGKHFSQMSTVEFSDAIDGKILPYYDERGCVIPLPKGNNTLNDFAKDE